VRKRSPHHYCCIMHGWHYISMHNSLNIFWFCQKLSWRGEELLSMNTFFNTSLCSWLGTGIFTWRKVRLNKVLYMKMLRKRCLKTVIFVLESSWKVLDFVQQKGVWI
jgi:hypothetical protein